MATRITCTFDATREETEAALSAVAHHIHSESGHGAARALASALDVATLEELTFAAARPWYCASCCDTHDGTTPAVHQTTARAQHNGAELVVELYGCARWSRDSLYRAAAATARSLRAMLEGDA